MTEDTITLRQEKGGRIASVPITPRLRKMLDECPRTGSPTILNHSRGRSWALTGNSFRSAWGDASEAAGIQGVTFHDLRGTFVTRCFEDEWTREEIAFCTGHSMRDLAMLERYANRKSITQVNAKRLAKRMNDAEAAKSCKPVCKPGEEVEAK